MLFLYVARFGSTVKAEIKVKQIKENKKVGTVKSWCKIMADEESGPVSVSAEKDNNKSMLLCFKNIAS